MNQHSRNNHHGRRGGAAGMLLSVVAILLLSLLLPGAVAAQRRVTPVEPTSTGTPAASRTENDKPDLSRYKPVKDSRGNVVLVDTITGSEYVDSTRLTVKPMLYPRLYQLSVGVNIWDGAMRCLGQHYGVGSIWAQLSLHNRFFPYFEAGLGQASITPDGNNYTFRSPLSPFFKIGASYNIFYNSNSAYQFLAGLRYGFTPFSYSVDNITLDDPYWQEQSSFAIPSQSATAGYLEIVLGVKVKIVDNFSMGWNAMFHTVLHSSASSYGESMYIPGYGKRNSSISAQLSLIWTFTLNHPAPPEVNNSGIPVELLDY